MKLVDIDSETANHSADSAGAIGIVSIEKGTITKKRYRLIRPPRPHFIFSYLHGISSADVEAQPTFSDVWDHLVSFWRDAMREISCLTSRAPYGGSTQPAD
jgi:DNA polymerase III epsilon subunit-like protein